MNNLYKEINNIGNKVALLEFLVMYKDNVIANQEKEINDLKNKESKTKVYHVVWATGHIQTLTACNSSEAYTKAFKNYTGADRIVDISVDEPIDFDEAKIEVPVDDTVVGCGLAEGDFGTCCKCNGENDPDECRDIRETLAFTKTTFRELFDSKVFNK